MRFPSRCYSLRREWEIGLVCPANLSLACGKVLPASKWSSKTSSAGNREICGKSEKRNKNFNKWIMSNCCHAIWSPEPSNLCLLLFIYNVHVLSFCDPWLWGHFVQVIGNLELRGSRKKRQPSLPWVSVPLSFWLFLIHFENHENQNIFQIWNQSACPNFSAFDFIC